MRTKYGKEKKNIGSLISCSRNLLFKAIDEVVFLLSLLARVIMREAAFFIIPSSTVLFSGGFIAAVHLHSLSAHCRSLGRKNIKMNEKLLCFLKLVIVYQHMNS